VKIPTWAIFVVVGGGLLWWGTRRASAAGIPAPGSPGIAVNPTKTPLATGEGTLSPYSAGGSTKSIQKVGPGGTNPAYTWVDQITGAGAYEAIVD
jgi:hypothetical protein